MNDNYAAIIIDIQHSRRFDEEERFAIQDKLLSIINFINKYYMNEIVKNFEFSSGDSIQALFKNVNDAISCYCFIRNMFYPYEVRCGIGYGKVNQKILDNNYNSTNMIDGDAYHYAISALNDCKMERYCFLVYSNKKENDDFVNQIMSTVELLNLDFTNKQSDVYNLFNLLYPLEIKYECQNVETISNFIIKILKKNILSYEFYNLVSDNEKKILFEEVIYNYCRRDKNKFELFGPAFPTKMNTICSILLDVSRQNIEKIRSVGKFDEIRKLELLILEYTKKEYNGGSQ